MSETILNFGHCELFGILVIGIWDFFHLIHSSQLYLYGALSLAGLERHRSSPHQSERWRFDISSEAHGRAELVSLACVG